MADMTQCLNWVGAMISRAACTNIFQTKLTPWLCRFTALRRMSYISTTARVHESSLRSPSVSLGASALHVIELFPDIELKFNQVLLSALKSEYRRSDQLASVDRVNAATPGDSGHELSRMSLRSSGLRRPAGAAHPSTTLAAVATGRNSRAALPENASNP